jgi:hypothetical protein
MAITEILASLDEEIARLEQVKKLLGGGSGAGNVRSAAHSAAANGTGKPKRKKFSAEARAKMAAAQRARWAKQKAEK